MRLDYWDTSGLIRAFTRAEKPKGITRPHSVAEFFCVLTGPGLAVSVLEPGDAVVGQGVMRLGKRMGREPGFRQQAAKTGAELLTC